MQEERIKAAKKRVKAKKEFYEHLSTYVVMGIFFFVLNFLTSPGAWWFYWPMLGWGIGVLFHAMNVFGIPGIGQIDKAWEEEALRKEMEKMEMEEGDWINDVPEEKPLSSEQKKSTWNEQDLV